MPPSPTAPRALAIALPLLLALAGRAWAGGEIVIDGLDKEAEQNVLLYLTIAQQKDQPGMTEGRIQALHQRAPDDIRAALKPLGYYRPTIQASLTIKQDDWSARYRVNPGPPLRIAKLDIKVLGAGADDPAYQTLLTKLPIAPGGIAHHGRYEETKLLLQNMAVERGYFDAHMITSMLRIDLDDYSASVVLHFDTGPRYRFGIVTFHQYDGLEPEFLQRYVPFKAGDPYTNSGLLSLQTGLSDSEYFQQVEVEPRRDLASGQQVPIDVRLTARLPDRYTIGAGYGTDTGVRGKAGWERRLLNRTGQRVSTDLSASEIRTELSARYAIPIGNPRTDLVAVTAGWIHDYPEDSDSRTTKLGTSLSHSRGKVRETWSIDLQRDYFDIGDTRDRTTLVLPGVSWLWVEADDRMMARRGTRVQFDVRGSSTTLGSDVSVRQERLQAKLIRPIGAGGRVILRGDAGANHVSDFDTLPVSFRFFAGGDQSIRGYTYNSLGPTDTTGQVIGGRYLTVGSFEYEQRLSANWAVATFYDIGRAFSESDEPYSKGAGAGLRWRTPVGPIRLDVAWALSDPERPWRLHISVGPDL